MPFPASGGDTRIKLISSGNLRQPKAGDVLNAKLGKNIAAGGFTVSINRGAGFTTLTTVLPYTLQAADIPAIGGTFPIYVTAADLSLRSDTTNFTNPLTVPGAPIIGTAVPGNGQAAVLFTPPANNGGTPITKYTVYAFDMSGQLFRTQDATQSPVPFTGLTNGMPYSFRVLAVNAVGPGPLSEFSNTVTPAVATTPTEMRLVEQYDVNGNNTNTFNRVAVAMPDRSILIIRSPATNTSQIALGYRDADNLNNPNPDFSNPILLNPGEEEFLQNDQRQFFARQNLATAVPGQICEIEELITL